MHSRLVAFLPGARASLSRSLASGPPSLRRRLEEVIPAVQNEAKELNAKHGDFVLGNVTVSKAMGGARSVPCIVWETSLLDENKGISFRGHTIPEIQKVMPTIKPGGEPTPEGMLWLLLTGEVPTAEEAASVTEELHSRAELPKGVRRIINSLRKDMHPMTQLSIAVMAMQAESKFAKAYQDGVKKSDYWKYTFEDALDLIARLPEVAAMIYRRTYHDGVVAPFNPSLDYAANLARMMGFNNAQFDELMRLYLVIHCDHEGGNVSAHTTHLVGSALSDPYLSLAAGLNGLAGPLHGLANQEVLRWVLELQAKFHEEGKEVNHDTIKQFAWDTLKGHKVIPGYGHAVLRITDPRYTCQREFAQKYLPHDPLFKIVSTIYEVVPDVLKEHGKTKNPFPNVDAHSGVLLTHYGLTEHTYYTVLFGVSRAIGVMSQLILSRAMGFPLERPKSLTMEAINTVIQKTAAAGGKLQLSDD